MASRSGNAEQEGGLREQARAGQGREAHILKEIVKSEAGGVAGECSQAFKEAFKQGSYALHVHARVLGARARVAHGLQVC